MYVDFITASIAIFCALACGWWLRIVVKETPHIFTHDYKAEFIMLLVSDGQSYEDAVTIATSLSNDQIRKACQTFKKYPSSKVGDGK